MQQDFIKKFKITYLLMAINILVYVITEILGDTEDAYYMMQMGAVYPPCITEDGEYWRLLSSNVLHFGLPHLLNNLVMLASAGQILERAIGMWKFLLLYVAAGIGGSALSLGQMLQSGDYSVSAGASGAIFGIIGALAWIVIVHKGHYESLTGRGMVAMLVLSLYYGISTGNVDNWGHIGGLLMGFVMGIALYRKPVTEGEG